MYLNVTEIEAALVALSAAYPNVTELITLPNATHQGRTSQVLRLGAQGADQADGILLVGGVHAREWIPPDALVSLAADLLEAYAGGTGLGYGGASYSAAQVMRLLETLNLFVYPCVNPDGRQHSQTAAANWRKNRRPAPPGASGANCVGVDLNRNFDFLWDHEAKFAADSGVSASSDPCHPTIYRGPSAGSEPETGNVVWVLDTYPRIRWHVDVHSAVPVILHSWGSDENQTTDPTQSFTNPALDSVRGRIGDGIGEYLAPEDQAIVTTLAARLDDGVFAASGSRYGVEQAMTLYPTSGASDDYAFSRHFADPAAGTVYAWTVECGTSFQPAYAAAESVIREVSSGLIAFALGVHEVTDGLRVVLRTSAVVFTGVPEGETTARALVFDCSGERDIHLEVTGVTGAFALPLGATATVAGPGHGNTVAGRIWLTWTAGVAGTAAAGSVTVRCPETGESWTVPVTADAVARPSAAVALVLDRSGSMSLGAGDGRSRVEVLREAASIFVELLQPDTGVAVVRFDHDADTALGVQLAGPEVFGPGRAAASAAVAGHLPNPAGATSIGDGVERASAILHAAAVDFDVTAMVVLTDGQENAPKFLAEVSAALGEHVFAIGLGTAADINPAALGVLTDGTSGWVAVSGVLSVDERFLLAQYFLQALAGLTNQQVVLRR